MSKNSRYLSHINPKTATSNSKHVLESALRDAKGLVLGRSQLKGLSGFENCKESCSLTVYWIFASFPILMICIKSPILPPFARKSRTNFANILLEKAKLHEFCPSLFTTVQASWEMLEESGSTSFENNCATFVFL